MSQNRFTRAKIYFTNTCSFFSTCKMYFRSVKIVFYLFTDINYVLFSSRCTLAKRLEGKTLNVPPPKPLADDPTTPAPYVIVADDAFPLRSYIMKPFPFRNQSLSHRVYNYRLSRVRRIIENVFGICATRFRLLLKPIDMKPEKVTKAVLAICALHNYLMTHKASSYVTDSDFDSEVDGVFVSGNWRNELTANGLDALSTSGRNAEDATEVRNRFMQYFTSPQGEVEWQYRSCGIK